MSIDEWFLRLQGADDKQSLHLEIDRMLRTEVISIEAKMDAIRLITELYFQITGVVPDAAQLDRLSAWVLKGREKEACVKSERQLRRIRQEKEFCYAQPERREFDARSEGNRRKRRRVAEP
ncbi:hypothetical protein [Paenibacillus arenilitoris]|uniref:Uncharacterized protein n=1 Tax=Paenibacillus arenilitoris TaxID=2772299 RepID=A0A927CLB8_9BACL|nr:hypothetical protein [Paenibacillus arenilitoris]MBD2867745.1 hypothetical protein [Paenibacillus arenilitoris]